ncbi:cytochrome P450 716B1-like [Diospyros lotus]|uniref:cytochrome P450 716B1-like n=1 Tax=Diospyros lotus TaxID=55363 RepID=UPI00225C2AA2|nr:cytochrome P450 716B1-like [Diospyros lotus]
MDQFFKYLCLFLIPVLLLLKLIRRRSSQKLPPGSLGLPLIGQSFGLLGAMRSNAAEKWLEERVRKYGPISKLSLFGKPTVFIHGPAANKFVFNSDGDSIGNQQVTSIRKILGERNILELSGEDHKRVRGALVSFLKPESLKEYVGKMEAEVRRHLRLHWEGRQTVTVLPLAKTLTFNIICSLLFGVEFGSRRDELVDCFQQMMEGMWSVPLNLPFSRFSRSLRASARARAIAKDLIREKRLQLEQQTASPRQDLITCLLSIRDDDNRQVVSDDEIVDNILLVMVAGHDTSSILITFMLRLFCINPAIHAAVVQEQEDIVKSKKSSGESVLRWEDLAKMKYTWKVALETLRMFPPIFGGFRNTLKDIEFGGYLIPKGWQIFWASSMTHMDANIFKEPSKFDPTRFENQSSIPPYCFVAFGGGPRICPGYEFARLETLVAIHHIVTRFTWKLCCSDDSFIRDPLPVPAQGLPIQILPKTLP